MGEKQFTVHDVLQAAVGVLEDIQVPVKYSLTIGKPIGDVIGALAQCISALEGGEKVGDDHAE